MSNKQKAPSLLRKRSAGRKRFSCRTWTIVLDCQIDGTVIQNVKDYSLVQSSNGKALLNLTIEISAEVVSTTIQAQMQQHL